MSAYSPLWCRSNFSFLEGASHPEELVETAERLGLAALALTDRDGVQGMVRAHVKAKELGVRLLVGSEVSVDDGSTVVLLAKDREGYANLCGLVTKGRLRSAKGECRVSWSEVAGHASGLVLLWGGPESLLAREAPPEREASLLREAFGEDAFALVPRHREDEEVALEARLRERARRFGLPVVAATEVLYHTRARRPLQDVLTCIRHGVTLHEAGRRTKPNDRHALLSPHAFGELWADDPAAVARTLEVAGRCRFSLSEVRYRYPSEALPDGMTSAGWLRMLTFEGARQRYGGAVPEDVTAQLERELALIDELDYPGYFLTMHHLVQFCRQEGILCQGRGSAANSAVCYCLGVTAVDPVRLDLLFERFLSRERAEPPDIDLDIEHERREEVIQHVYETWGRDHAAMVANVIRYRAKSAVREVGKVLGLPQTSLDRLAKMVGWWDPPSPEVMRQVGLDPDAHEHRLLRELVAEVLDFPRHLSIHPGGFLLGAEPVHRLVPIENASMEARTIVQWSKDDIEELGLFKVDLLGLGSLTAVHKCFDLLREHHGVDLAMATVPPEDPATFEMIRRGDTLGVFQIESRAQMAMLPRLRPETFYDLVVEVSIVRPGPITGGMVHPYLRRRQGLEPVVYPHPCLEPVLKKTLGVPLFQEQVMKLAIVAADYTPGESDQLRRDMAAWRQSGRLERHHDRLVGRMVAKGIAPEFAERVFEQIKGFGEYGFPESHAASFALISYAMAWLKCHHPDAFFCSLLNAQPMGFYSPATLVHGARRAGVEVRPIDVQASAWDCTLEPPALRMGLRYVKGLGEAERARLEAAIPHRPFATLDDFVRKVRLREDQLACLAEAGAFESLGLDRREALWKVRRLARAAPLLLPFSPAAAEPEIRFPPLGPLTPIAWDYERTDHSPRGHLLGPLRPWLLAQGLRPAAAVHALRDGTRTRYAGLVICRQRPGTAKGVLFATLEDETGFVNLVIWESVFERYPALCKAAQFLGVTGRVQSTDGVVHVVADHLWPLDLPLLDAVPAAPRLTSRDFQ